MCVCDMCVCVCVCMHACLCIVRLGPGRSGQRFLFGFPCSPPLNPLPNHPLKVALVKGACLCEPTNEPQGPAPSTPLPHSSVCIQGHNHAYVSRSPLLRPQMCATTQNWNFTQSFSTLRHPDEAFLHSSRFYLGAPSFVVKHLSLKPLKKQKAGWGRINLCNLYVYIPYIYIYIYVFSMRTPYQFSPRRRCTPISCESKNPRAGIMSSSQHTAGPRRTTRSI